MFPSRLSPRFPFSAVLVVFLSSLFVLAASSSATPRTTGVQLMMGDFNSKTCLEAVKSIRARFPHQSRSIDFSIITGKRGEKLGLSLARAKQARFGQAEQTLARMSSRFAGPQVKAHLAFIKAESGDRATAASLLAEPPITDSARVPPSISPLIRQAPSICASTAT